MDSIYPPKYRSPLFGTITAIFMHMLLFSFSRFLFEYAYPIMISTPENSFLHVKFYSEIYDCFLDAQRAAFVNDSRLKQSLTTTE